jgi:hypothetical protein
MGDTAPQAIIDRVTAEGGQAPGRRNGSSRHDSGALQRPAQPPQPGQPPQAQPPQAQPPQAQQSSHPAQTPQVSQDSAPMPRPQPRDSGPIRRPKPPDGQQPRRDSGALPRPPQESGAMPRPPQDSGTLRRPPQNSGAMPRPQQESGALPRPPQNSAAMPRPDTQDDQTQVRPPLPSRGRARRQPPPPVPPPANANEETRSAIPPMRPDGQQGSLTSRLDGSPAEPEAPPADQGGPMASGAFAAPPRRPRRPRAAPRPQEAEPHTEQFAAVEQSSPDALNGEAPAPDEPPAGLAGWRQQRRQTQLEDTEVGVMPVTPEKQDDDPRLGGPPTQGFAPFLSGERSDPGFPAVDDDLREDDLDDDYDFPDEDADHGLPIEDEYDEDEPSPGRQWLALAGQLALGVAGGAGVWLAFNWLWVRIPAAALVGALAVIVGLVWIVRKIRRADDMQTTVLAVLVGLVVTVSPAALLLLAK